MGGIFKAKKNKIMKHNIKEYYTFLKEKGLQTHEILFSISIMQNGLTMTKAVSEFNDLYDKGEIDGFPCSSIEVLERFYGKRILKMTRNTLIKKVTYLQRCLLSDIDLEQMEQIEEAVDYFLAT